jgi:hypothetical protein
VLMTIKLPLISAPYLVLLEFTSDTTLTVATYASALGIASVLLQDMGGLQPFSYAARTHNNAKRGYSYSAYEIR